MNKDSEIRYIDSDVWVRKDSEVLVSGVTDYAQESLSDMVFIEFLCKEGQYLKKGESFVCLESVKAAVDIYMPMSGTILAMNEDLTLAPEVVNSSPYIYGWLIVFEPEDLTDWNQILNENSYQQLLQKN